METDRLLPTNDVLFKMIFGNRHHSKILIHFLNSVINPSSPIEKVNILKTELTPEYLSQKGVRLDILATTEESEIINVEMQRKDEKDMAARALFYWSQLFAGQLEIGQEYQNLKRTISISILDFTLFKKDERYWRKGYVKDDLTGENFTNLLEMHFLELNKMRQVREESPITFWIEFFKNPYSEKVASLCKFVPEIKEAKEVFEKAKSDPEARELIRVREKATRDYASDIKGAKGEGREEGIRETAYNLLAMGLTSEQISKATGLSIDEIQKLNR